MTIYHTKYDPRRNKTIMMYQFPFYIIICTILSLSMMILDIRESSNILWKHDQVVKQWKYQHYKSIWTGKPLIADGLIKVFEVFFERNEHQSKWLWNFFWTLLLFSEALLYKLYFIFRLIYLLLSVLMLKITRMDGGRMRNGEQKKEKEIFFMKNTTTISVN